LENHDTVRRVDISKLKRSKKAGTSAGMMMIFLEDEKGIRLLIRKQ